MHKEYIYENNISNTAILFIHGILESPNQFEDFIEALDNKFTVFNVLLPGHGKSGKDFARSSMNEWSKYIEDAVLSLENKYDNIIIVAHSMGTLLAIEIYNKHPEKIKVLFLLAVPLHIKLSFSGAINGIKVALNKVKSSDIIAIEAKKAYSIDNKSIVTYIYWIPRYIELYIKCRQARAILRKIEVPTIIYQSKKDEFVRRKSIRYFKGKENFEPYELTKSRHFYYDKNERSIMIKRLINYINSIKWKKWVYKKYRNKKITYIHLW